MSVDRRGDDAGKVAIILYLQPAALPDDPKRPVTRVELVPNRLSSPTSILAFASINDNYIPAYLPTSSMVLLSYYQDLWAFNPFVVVGS